MKKIIFIALALTVSSVAMAVEKCPDPIKDDLVKGLTTLGTKPVATSDTITGGDGKTTYKIAAVAGGKTGAELASLISAGTLAGFTVIDPTDEKVNDNTCTFSFTVAREVKEPEKA